MGVQSAGILVYRFQSGTLQVLLVHPGGPFWAKKDKGAWSIPKGEHSGQEDAFQAARRELKEETGFEAQGQAMDLGVLRQPGGKRVHIWAVEGDFDPHEIRSNTFEMEWPPKSNQVQRFPEVDRAAWFTVPEAKEKLHKGQVGFIDRLCLQLGVSSE